MALVEDVKRGIQRESTKGGAEAREQQSKEGKAKNAESDKKAKA